jgi:phage terminase large subunit
MSNLKRTVLKDFEALCYGLADYNHALYPSLQINKSDWSCKIHGNTISFFGLKDDPMRVYGFASDVFFINESISTYKNTFDQLEQRCRGFWLLDCNPSEPHSWVYELERRPDVSFFRSTYLDNPFLPQSIINKIESYEDTEGNRERGTADPRKWSIYGKGIVHKGPEIIYPDWTTYEDEPEGYDHIFYGLDWGHNHPLACVKLLINNNDLYVSEVLYSSELEWDDITERILHEPLIAERNAYVVCDSSEPRSIKTLIRAGIPALAVKKGKGSVLDGIRKIQSMNIHIHIDSR